MAQHRRADSSGQNSAVHLHLKEKSLSFEDSNVNILAITIFFWTGVKESISICQTGTTVFTYHPPTWVLSPGSLTTIHTWAHLALVTHTKASWTNYPQVALMTLKLSAHTCPWWICKDTPTQSLKVCKVWVVFSLVCRAGWPMYRGFVLAAAPLGSSPSLGPFAACHSSSFSTCLLSCLQAVLSIRPKKMYLPANSPPVS